MPASRRCLDTLVSMPSAQALLEFLSHDPHYRFVFHGDDLLEQEISSLGMSRRARHQVLLVGSLRVANVRTLAEFFGQWNQQHYQEGPYLGEIAAVREIPSDIALLLQESRLNAKTGPLHYTKTFGAYWLRSAKIVE